MAIQLIKYWCEVSNSLVSERLSFKPKHFVYFILSITTLYNHGAKPKLGKPPQISGSPFDRLLTRSLKYKGYNLRKNAWLGVQYKGRNTRRSEPKLAWVSTLASPELDMMEGIRTNTRT